MILVESKRDIVALMENWLEANAPRLSGRFEIERVGDWDCQNENGFGLDFFHGKVAGRVTAWPKRYDAEWPFADAEAVDIQGGEQLFYWAFEEFSAPFLDRWLQAVESLATEHGRHES